VFFLDIIKYLCIKVVTGIDVSKYDAELEQSSYVKDVLEKEWKKRGHLSVQETVREIIANYFNKAI
jgi:hypothetical protein